MIIGTVLTAVLVKYTFPYNWDWVESLLFGAMFSATDPVAVVAVLKEVSIASRSGLIIKTSQFGRKRHTGGIPVLRASTGWRSAYPV